MTPRDWAEANNRPLYDILMKLEQDDLADLCRMFECSPGYIGTPEKGDYAHYLITKLQELRQGTASWLAMCQALDVLKRGGR